MFLSYPTEPDGTWNCNGVELGQVSSNVYGALCKLRDYEKTGLEPSDFRSDSYEKAFLYKIFCTKSVPAADGGSKIETTTIYCPDENLAYLICAMLKSNGYMDAVVNKYSWQAIIEK